MSLFVSGNQDRAVAEQAAGQARRRPKPKNTEAQEAAANDAKAPAEETTKEASAAEPAQPKQQKATSCTWQSHNR